MNLRFSIRRLVAICLGSVLAPTLAAAGTYVCCFDAESRAAMGRPEWERGFQTAQLNPSHGVPPICYLRSDQVKPFAPTVRMFAFESTRPVAIHHWRGPARSVSTRPSDARRWMDQAVAAYRCAVLVAEDVRRDEARRFVSGLPTPPSLAEMRNCWDAAQVVALEIRRDEAERFVAGLPGPNDLRRVWKSAQAIASDLRRQDAQRFLAALPTVATINELRSGWTALIAAAERQQRCDADRARADRLAEWQREFGQAVAALRAHLADSEAKTPALRISVRNHLVGGGPMIVTIEESYLAYDIPDVIREVWSVFPSAAEPFAVLEAIGDSFSFPDTSSIRTAKAATERGSDPVPR